MPLLCLPLIFAALIVRPLLFRRSISAAFTAPCGTPPHLTTPLSFLGSQVCLFSFVHRAPLVWMVGQARICVPWMMSVLIIFVCSLASAILVAFHPFPSGQARWHPKVRWHSGSSSSYHHEPVVSLLGFSLSLSHWPLDGLPHASFFETFIIRLLALMTVISCIPRLMAPTLAWPSLMLVTSMVRPSRMMMLLQCPHVIPHIACTPLRPCGCLALMVITLLGLLHLMLTLTLALLLTAFSIGLFS